MQASTPSVRICNWNIDRSGVRGLWRSELQANWIASQHADIAVITEVHDTLEIEGLQPACFSADGQLPYRDFEHAVGVWTRLPVLGTLPVRTPRLATCAVLESPLGTLVVYGTILPYREEGATQGLQRWQAHRETLELQLQDWDDIRRQLPDHHLVVAGDFNMTLPPSNAYVDQASRDRLLKTCGALGLEVLTGDDVRAIVGRSNIDHVFWANRLAATRPKEYWMAHGTVDGVQRALSDHNGVTVTLGLPASISSS